MHGSVYKYFHIYSNIELRRKIAPAFLRIRQSEIKKSKINLSMCDI